MIHIHTCVEFGVPCPLNWVSRLCGSSSDAVYLYTLFLLEHYIHLWNLRLYVSNLVDWATEMCKLETSVGFICTFHLHILMEIISKVCKPHWKKESLVRYLFCTRLEILDCYYCYKIMLWTSDYLARNCSSMMLLFASHNKIYFKYRKPILLR